MIERDAIKQKPRVIGVAREELQELQELQE